MKSRGPLTGMIASAALALALVAVPDAPVANDGMGVFYEPVQLLSHDSSPDRVTQFTPRGLAGAGDNLSLGLLQASPHDAPAESLELGISGVGMDGFSVAVRGWNTGSDSEPARHGLGAEASFMGFTVGGAYGKATADSTLTLRNSDRIADLGSSWTLGARYETNHGFTLGARYAESRDDGLGLDSVYKERSLGLGATYVWQPGLRSFADLSVFERDRDTLGAADGGDRSSETGSRVIFGTGFDF